MGHWMRCALVALALTTSSMAGADTPGMMRCGIASGTLTGCTLTPAVPANTRFVTSYLSYSICLRDGGIYRLYVADGTGVDFLPLAPVIGAPPWGDGSYTLGTPYVTSWDAGTTPTVAFSSTGGYTAGSCGMTVTVRGHYEAM